VVSESLARPRRSGSAAAARRAASSPSISPAPFHTSPAWVPATVGSARLGGWWPSQCSFASLCGGSLSSSIRLASHSLRAPRVHRAEPLGGSSSPHGSVASASPRATEAAGRGTLVPPASSRSPSGGPSPSPGCSTWPLQLGPAPSLRGLFCREVHTGLYSLAPSRMPSSGATRPLGGRAAETSCVSSAAPHFGTTAAVAPGARPWATAAVIVPTWVPPSPSRAPMVLFTAPVAPACL
jgi:hypothetical protein